MTIGGVPIDGDLSAKFLVGLVVLMILTDQLVTKKRLNEERKEKVYWRTAAQISHKQVLLLIGKSRLHVKTLASLGVDSAKEEAEEVDSVWPEDETLWEE